jgi:predicted NUDIX family NTP pyrophosphohydrolase
VLLVHASGNYNRHKPWSIPKGEPDDGESLEAAACRETLEETGVAVSAASLTPLGSVVYRRSGKRVHCFAGPAPADAEPYCASWEVDAAEFVELALAKERVYAEQAEFLDRLLPHLPADVS